MWRRHIFIAVLFMDVLPSSAWAQDQGRFWQGYQVTRQGGGLGIEIDEVVKFSFSGSPENRHWIAERTKRDSNWCGRRESGKCRATTNSVHEWIDGARCPELRQALTELATIKFGGFAPPDGIVPTMVSDTPFTEVTGYPAAEAGVGPRLKLGAFEGPIVDWWDRSETRLQHCWTGKPVGNG